MNDEDKMYLLIAGSIAAVFVILLVYSTIKKNENQPVVQASSAPVHLPASVTFGSPSNPTGYYKDTPQKALTQFDLTAVVQNEEKITWTDWLGRPRAISISRTVH